MKGGTKIITKEQFVEIIQTIRNGFLTCKPNERVAMALILEGNIGIRISDVVQFTLNNIIKEDGQYRLSLIEQKTKKKRTFIIPEELVQYIRQYCIDNNIKSNEIIIPLTPRAIQKHLRLACDYLGNEYKNVSTHSFRKFFANNLYYNNGEDILLVKEALQHSSVETTQRYLGVSSKKLEQALKNNFTLI